MSVNDIDSVYFRLATSNTRIGKHRTVVEKHKCNNAKRKCLKFRTGTEI